MADGGLLVEPEHDGQVQRVGPVSQGFLELPVDAQSFEGGFLFPEPGVDPVPADPVRVPLRSSG